MSRVDAVLLDLDDTLLEYVRSPGEVLAAAFDRAAVDPFFDVAEYYARYDEFLDASDGIDDLRATCFAAIATDAGYDSALGRRVAREYTAERDHANVRFLPGAEAALDTLASDHALAVVTNGAREMQRTKMDALGVRERVDDVVYAGDETPAKPDPAPFARALERLDSPPERAVHAGNSLTTDVPGAAAAGLRTVWVPADPGLTPDPEPDWSLAELADLTAPPWR